MAQESPENPVKTGDKKSHVLATFMQLERHVRHSGTIEKFRFIVVNETHHLVHYDQAVLWKVLPGKQAEIEAISGVSAISP